MQIEQTERTEQGKAIDENYKNIEHLQTAIKNFHLPRYADLPDMGLYLDQVVRFCNHYTRLCEGSELTPSMVSNYVKQKIIPGPTRKCYGRESIAYLIFVAYTKVVIPISDIHTMIGIQMGSYDLSTSYNYFCEEFENLLQYVYGLKAAPDPIGRDNTAQKELLRSCLLSITYKIYLVQYIEFLNTHTTAAQGKLVVGEENWYPEAKTETAATPADTATEAAAEN